MTIRTSLLIASVMAVTFSGVTQRSFSSSAKTRAVEQFQGVGVAAAAKPQDDKTPLDHMEMCPVDAQQTGSAKRQLRCGNAGLYDPKSSCCCNPVKDVYKIAPKGHNPNCSAPCKAAGKKGAR